MEAAVLQELIGELAAGREEAAQRFLNHFGATILQEIQDAVRLLVADAAPGETESLAVEFCAELNAEGGALGRYRGQVEFPLWLRAAARDFACRRLAGRIVEEAQPPASQSVPELLAEFAVPATAAAAALPREEVEELLAAAARELSARDRLLLQLACRGRPPRSLSQAAEKLHLAPKFTGLALVRLKDRLAAGVEERSCARA